MIYYSHSSSKSNKMKQWPHFIFSYKLREIKLLLMKELKEYCICIENPQVLELLQLNFNFILFCVTFFFIIFKRTSRFVSIGYLCPISFQFIIYFTI